MMESHSSIDLSSNSTNRFGARSRNMFFVRHTAAPKHLRTIFGVNGNLVCSMNENEYKLPENVKRKIEAMFKTPSINKLNTDSHQPRVEYITDPKYKLGFNSDYNKDLLNSYMKYIKPKNLKERVFPPIKHWTATYSLGLDTHNWQFELNNLGKMIGIMTTDEIKSETNRLAEIRKLNDFESSKFTRSFIMPNSQTMPKRPSSPHLRTSQDKLNFDLNDESNLKRFNETRKSTTRIHRSTSKYTSGSSLINSKYILCNDESDREMWLLKILSQILDTESLLDVQTWLVSADLDEKNAMKDLIKKAIEGLNQNGRVDLNQLVINPNDKQTQVDFEKINDSVNKLVENQKNVNALLTETAVKNSIEKEKSNQNELLRQSMSAIETKFHEKQQTHKNFLSLNPKLSADFYKMTRKKKREFNSLNTSLQITNDDKTNSNKLNESCFNDNELEFPSRDIINYDIKDLNMEFSKPKKVVNILTLE